MNLIVYKNILKILYLNKESIEKMKKLIEEKKKKGQNTKNTDKATKKIGAAKKGRSSHNGGGLFDK